MLEHFLRLAEHAVWANRALGTLLLREGAPSEAHRLFAHVVATERLYLARMQGLDPWPQDFWPELAPELALARAEEVAHAYRAWLTSLAPARLSERVRYRTSKGVEQRTALADLLTQVFLHGSYHRGQANALLRRAGLEPAHVDFIDFVRASGG